ncbi:MAG: rod shape-determining protein [Deltaproteobacteria bacterium]|nr:MAG: rod shape-determining protein [Deltaproteobacteria bacterium]
MFQSVFGALSADLAIDLGTSHTRIYVQGRGIECCQATAVAMHRRRRGQRHVIAVGDEALDMLGRTPPDIEVVQPVRDGVIQDFEAAEAVLRHLVLEVQGRRLWLSPRAAICVPHGTGDMERRALKESAEASGVRNAVLVEQPLACALGAELPVDEACGHMVIDIGGGRTSVSVLSLSGVVHHHELRLGGSHLDQAIAHHLREHHGLHIGPRTAEDLKLRLAGALPGGTPDECEVRGRHVAEGWPRAAVVTADEIREALAQPVRLLVEGVISVLEHTPPDLAADIAETGVVMTGGGALLRSLDQAIGEATGLPVVVPEDPTCVAVMGAAWWLEDAPARAAVAK